LHYSKDAFSSIEAVFKVVAIGVAALWTYRLFVRKRETFPKAKLKHTVSFWDGPESSRIIRVTLLVENNSDVLLQTPSGRTWVQQMKPWPEQELTNFTTEQEVEMKAGGTEDGADLNILSKGTEIKWPLIAERNFRGEREIEPKESDEVIMDFVIDNSYEQVLVYSFVENFAKPGRHLSWSLSTVVNFQELAITTGPATTSDEGEGQMKEKARPSEVGQHKNKQKPKKAT